MKKKERLLDPSQLNGDPRQLNGDLVFVCKLRYRVFFLTVYSMGLRLGEGLQLQVGDIDGERDPHRVRIRSAKRVK